MTSNIDVVRSTFDRAAEGDMEGGLAAYAQDVEWHEPEGAPFGGVYHGVQELVDRLITPLMEEVPDFATTAEQFIADGDTVVVVARMGGTVKATGATFSTPLVVVYEVRDGKITRVQTFSDTAKVREAMRP